ncbi:uncharacterized protein N7443_010486 [Penicillium atrosanguineum]|uniref:Zn(2)-C6 fungal-type domain-containing protein n=1 Tax=Penicillium atrosanguineum TaxID=1132637 RepID=A0A9W9PS60_9EURO|nr:uncharacterized protein N7443_010486 [Penicillium atrosanguineum]KAJ5290233.1 hypothetical protein N7443_010486 [Penicillium atrosanguineum]KAJ5308057.1 hypothetical protein N7476_008713 [Penicillium atrosanguineum]
MYERQRVWRACQACRRKKIKCDGENPCLSCTRIKAECVYVEPHGNMRLVDPQYVVKLENRIAVMEKQLRQQSSVGEYREPVLSSEHPEAPPAEVHGDINCSSWSPVPAPDGALSEPPDAFRAPSTDAASQTAESIPICQPPVTDDNTNEVLYAVIFHGLDSNDEQNISGTEPSTLDVTRFEEPILLALIEIFYASIYPIFPIIHRRSFQLQYDRWMAARKDGRGTGKDETEFSFLFYALLAVAASIIPEEHMIFNQPEMEVYKRVDLADLLFSHATSISPGLQYQQNVTSAINVVIAQGLLSLFLTEKGTVNDAWVTAGHAIRLYQGLDVEDNMDAATNAHDMSCVHSNIWWCLYILDRSLSTALSKPLAIDDTESDIDSYEDEGATTSTLVTKTDPWFSIIAEFHITMGRIYKSVRCIRKSQTSNNAKLKDTLRSYVKKHDAELEKYYTKQVLPKIDAPSQTRGPLMLQTIAVSSYYIGLVLLYRTFIERFSIAEPDMFLRCAEAASNCIKATPQVLATVPASHFVIQQSRAIYASAKVLLYCMRLARNPTFTSKAWPDVQNGLDMLQNIKIKWPEIKKYQLLTEEDMQMTQMDLQKHDLFQRTFDHYGQEDHYQEVECQSKRRKVTRDIYLPQISDGPLPRARSVMQDDWDDSVDQMIVPYDSFLSDFVPQSTTSEDPSENFFGDAMLMSSIDHFFLNHEQ